MNLDDCLVLLHLKVEDCLCVFLDVKLLFDVALLDALDA